MEIGKLRTAMRLWLAVMLFGGLSAHASETAFTYQGVLKHNGEPVTTPINLAFRLYDSALGGQQIGAELELLNLVPDDGHLTVDLDFGEGSFPGSERWLEVRVNGAPLTPRQPVMPTPYAMYAAKVGSVPAVALAGTYDNAVELTNQDNVLAGDGSQLTMLSASNITTGTLYGGGLSGTYNLPLALTNSGNAFAGSGMGLHTLNASNITLGTLNDARLTSNIPRINAPNVFSQNNVFGGHLGIGTQPDQWAQVKIETPASAAVGGLVVNTMTTDIPFAGIQSSVYAPNAIGVEGFSFGSSGFGQGVYGISINSPNGIGVHGYSNSATGATRGGWFRVNSTSGRALHAHAEANSGATRGVWGEVNSSDGHAAYFTGPSGSSNYFQRSVGIGITDPAHTLHVAGQIRASSNSWVIRGDRLQQTGTFPGVWGTTESSSSGTAGIRGDANHTAPGATAAGVLGQSFSTTSSGVGVRGIHSAGGVGVLGNSSSGPGVQGSSTSSTGVAGYTSGSATHTAAVLGQNNSSSGTVYGVYGRTSSSSPGTAGVFGYATNQANFVTYGVRGDSEAFPGRGVMGVSWRTSGNGIGVSGHTESQDSGARGVFGAGFGNAVAVYAQGRFVATGTKSFKIDHPLDPENKYLKHFCTESPEPLNVYRGRVELDPFGEAWVELPEYFEAINRDPLYHLTAIGAAMPNLHIAVEVQDNRFFIAGGTAGASVSWRVEAVRNDRYVRNHDVRAEELKPEQFRGTYLQPELYGQPRERWQHYNADLVRPAAPVEPVLIGDAQ
jgi:hypothetical protein